MKTHIVEFYLDYFNNYLTPAGIAPDYGLTESQARRLIEIGRELHETQVAQSRSR